jgi:hypothetical protein
MYEASHALKGIGKFADSKAARPVWYSVSESNKHLRHPLYEYTIADTKNQ